jgi:hypothetical protein
MLNFKIQGRLMHQTEKKAYFKGKLEEVVIDEMSAFAGSSPNISGNPSEFYQDDFNLPTGSYNKIAMSGPFGET